MKLMAFHRLKDFPSFFKLWFLAFKEVKAMLWSIRLNYCFKPSKGVIHFQTKNDQWYNYKDYLAIASTLSK